MSNGATNVDHNIEVCIIAQLTAEYKEFKPQKSIRIAIGKYLMEHPTAKITAEQNRAIDAAKRDAARKEREKNATKAEIKKAAKEYKEGQEEQGDR